MKPRLLIGLAGVLGLAMPSVVMAQRGGSGGFAASGGHVAAVSAGAPHAASVVRTSSALPTTIPVGNSSVRARATEHAADVPSRHAGLSSSSSSSLRNQNAGNRIFAPIGRPLAPRHNPPPVFTPVGTPRVAYLLGVGGYYYAAPDDAAADQPQQALEQDDQQGDAPRARGGEQKGGGDRGGRHDRGENGNGGRGKLGGGAPVPDPR